MAQSGDGDRLMSGWSGRTSRVRIPLPALRIRGWLSTVRRRPSKPQFRQERRGSNPLPRALVGRGDRMAQHDSRATCVAPSGRNLWFAVRLGRPVRWIEIPGEA